MFTKMLAFEWRYFVRQPSFIVTCLVFFLLPYLAMVIDQVQIGSGGNVLFNSPFAIAQAILILGIFGMFMIANFIADTATRNHSSQMAEIVFTKPIQPFSYNLGRFTGAYLICLTVFAMVPLGTLVGSWMPWIDAERLGANRLSFYLVPFLIFSTTTIFVMASIFYAIARRFNTVMGVYLAALGLFILYVVAGQVFDEPYQRTLRALCDPFGLFAFGDFTRYWTSSEKNSQLVSLSGVILQNRVIWLTVGLSILAVAGGMFSGQRHTTKKIAKTNNDTVSIPLKTAGLSKYKGQRNAGWSQFITRTRFEIKQVFFSPAFLILLLFSTFQLVANFFQINGMFGTPNWPLTQTMVQLINGSFSLMLIIVITYYTAEIVWRERTVGMGDIIDSMPVHNLTFWMSKLLAVFLVIITLQAVGILASVAYQLIKDYSNIELSQYLISIMYFAALPFCLLAVLAFFIQSLSPGKYIGMLIFVAYFFASIVFSQIGLEHMMFQFAAAPSLQYSDLNGYGWYFVTQNWYMLYWTALAIVMGIISYGLWHRGPQSSLKQRFALLRYQLGKQGIAVAATALLVFIGSGAVIRYNTTILNTFQGQDETLDLRADYEKEFFQYLDDNIPTITVVDTAVDIFPKERRIEARAQITVVNKNKQAIKRFLVNMPRYTTQKEVKIDGGELGEINDKFDIAWFEFTEPMKPGESRTGTISVVREHHGFKDKDEDVSLVKNGTFINNAQLFPSFGFNAGVRINDTHERRKRDLEPLERAYPLEDSSHYSESFFGKGVDFIDFSATLSTSDDQFAIAPGYLQKQWQQDGRNYYRYEMDSPMVNFFSIMSARLERKKVEHNGVSIEVFYHPTHHWNVDRMIESSQDSLDYFESAFGPYQHKQLRIIEFPGYRSFAQSFANTVPYSEKIGFISDLRDPGDIDPVYYITAHEVAHQWWGHQLGAANVQGSAILSETLSQYSALMVMERKYGKTKLRKFLTFELDNYLRGRASERIEEMPLMRAENQQYLHYRKGSVVMMALKNKMGEQRVNQALQRLLNKFKFANDPYPTTLDLLAELNAQASTQEQAYIHDLFAQITLYDLRAEEVTSQPLENGQYRLSFTVSAMQMSADGKGVETEQDFDEQVEIAMFSSDPNDFSADNKVIYQALHHLKSGETTLEIEVDELPAYIGVDPFVRFIDRDTGNNIIKL
ncbi:MAG: ABC-2 type transport system permease protein [Paraglaciecola sp.]|jgi:ABC-2 type transport system permease protein